MLKSLDILLFVREVGLDICYGVFDNSGLFYIMFANESLPSDYTSPPASSQSLNHPIVSNHSMISPAPKDPTSLNLRSLRSKKRQADKVIQILQVRINYLQHKEQLTARKEENIKRRSEEIDRVRRVSEERRDMNEEVRRRAEEEVYKKIRSNSELRGQMEYNKVVVNSMLGASREREVQSMKSKKRRLKEQHELSVERANIELLQKVKRMKEERMIPSEKIEIFALNRMIDLKGIKERKLSMEMKMRRKNEERLSGLKETQEKLEKMAVFSEKYRDQCESEYYESRVKYRDFHRSRREIRKRQEVKSEERIRGEAEDSGIFLS